MSPETEAAVARVKQAIADGPAESGYADDVDDNGDLLPVYATTDCADLRLVLDALSTAEQTIASMTIVLGAERAGRLAAEARVAAALNVCALDAASNRYPKRAGFEAIVRAAYADGARWAQHQARVALNLPPPPTEASGSE